MYAALSGWMPTYVPHYQIYISPLSSLEIHTVKHTLFRVTWTAIVSVIFLPTYYECIWADPEESVRYGEGHVAQEQLEGGLQGFHAAHLKRWNSYPEAGFLTCDMQA